MSKRTDTVKIAQSHVGRNEKDGSFRLSIDTYNAVRPLPRGYAVKYTDEWCAAEISAIAIEAGVNDIIPCECNCGEMIKLFQCLGEWVENDA
jgi:hypothetical protein